jgi:hypothetical protein
MRKELARRFEDEARVVADRRKRARALFACAHTAVDVVATTHQKTTKERRARMMKR